MEGMGKVGTPAVVQNKDGGFKVRLYNGCYNEMRDINSSKALIIHLV